MTIKAETLTIPKMDGVEISPGIIIIGEPTVIPNTNKLRALAQIGAGIGIVELAIKFA